MGNVSARRTRTVAGACWRASKYGVCVCMCVCVRACMWGVFYFITARKRCLRRLCFVHVSHSVHRGGVPGQVPPRTRYTPRTRYPPDQVHPPGTRYPLDQVHPPQNQVAPPGSRYTPGAVHAGRYGQQAGGTHPTGMRSCFVKSLF